MKSFDFSLFTDRQLRNLAQQVKLEYLKRTKEARRLAHKKGLVEGAGPMYRNPDNPAETWSGKGLQPAWVQAALARGRSLDDLKFSDDRPVARPGGKQRAGG